MKVLIIGGVAGGATAAARLRRLNEKAQIIMLERSGYISYANCGLPYYIGGEIVDKRNLTLQTPESFFNRFRIDVRVKQEAIEIDRDNHIVKVNLHKKVTEFTCGESQALDMYYLLNENFLSEEEISIYNATDLAIYFAGCEDVDIDSVKMRVYIDGISPDNSKNVRIPFLVLYNFFIFSGLVCL